MKLDQGTCKNFRKDVYISIKTPSAKLLIHYIGDEKLSFPQPHGNSKKQTKLFFRTKPSVLQTMEQKISTHVPAAKLYKDEVANEITITGAPRDLKQVQNVKEKMKQDGRFTRDAIANVHELAYNNPGIIHIISTYPDLIIIMGIEQMLAEFQEVLRLHSKQQLLSYDTTFCLGEFYVSPLLFRHTAFKCDPVMMAGCLIHERKLQSHHKQFFKTIFSKVQAKGHPIATDEEAAINNAISSETNLIRVGCHKHMVNNIKRWVDLHGGTKDDRSVSVQEFITLMACETYNEFTVLYSQKEKRWSEAFVSYFRQRILPKVDEYGIWALKNFYECKTPVTTNQSEGFNTILKSLQNWKEVPLDAFVLSLQMLQKFYLNEIKRGKASLGTFELKPDFKHMALNFDELHIEPIVRPCNIIESLKNKTFIPEQNLPNQIYSNAKYTQAFQFVCQDAIAYSAKLGMFTVFSERATAVVKLFPKETCSCPTKK